MHNTALHEVYLSLLSGTVMNSASISSSPSSFLMLSLLIASPTSNVAGLPQCSNFFLLGDEELYGMDEYGTNYRIVKKTPCCLLDDIPLYLTLASNGSFGG